MGDHLGPGSGPSRPANHAPSPTPGSSATSSSSPTPPKGAGPLHATAEARPPRRSSPAYVIPLTNQPGGNGHGSHTGTRVSLSSHASASAPGLGAA